MGRDGKEGCELGLKSSVIKKRGVKRRERARAEMMAGDLKDKTSMCV